MIRKVNGLGHNFSEILYIYMKAVARKNAALLCSCMKNARIRGRLVTVPARQGSSGTSQATRMRQILEAMSSRPISNKTR